MSVHSTTPDACQPLAGKTVVVTGASSGLGAQFSRAIHQAGGHVVAAARRLESLEKLADSLERCTVVQCDVTDANDRDRLMSRVTDEFGQLDGLVNNAGVVNWATALKEDVDDFRRVMEVNVVAPFALAQSAASIMRNQEDGGAIVNISSIIAMRSISFQPFTSYAASKAAVAGLTRELAQQWARYGIRVNAIAPGPFPSEMGEAYESGPIADKTSERIPMGRVGRDGELDGALIYLLSAASSYVTGQTIVVDGGMIITG